MKMTIEIFKAIEQKIVDLESIEDQANKRTKAWLEEEGFKWSKSEQKWFHENLEYDQKLEEWVPKKKKLTRNFSQ
ncbi:hypothetical protein KKI24_18110 [bacterium]|nr:hypothetical protein [bacterium]